MKLTKTSTFREFISTIHDATFADAAKNGSDPQFQSSYALGALEHLAMEMAKASPAAMALLNNYIAENQPAPVPTFTVEHGTAEITPETEALLMQAAA